jgi:hypothetical protein
MSAVFGPTEAIDNKKGTRMTAIGNCWHEKEICEPTDFVALYNAQSDPDLKPDAGWIPTLYGSAKTAESTKSAHERVLSESGPGRAYNNKN